jgi:hypothetical protein
MADAACRLNEHRFALDETNDIAFRAYPGTGAAAEALHRIYLGVQGGRLGQSRLYGFGAYGATAALASHAQAEIEGPDDGEWDRVVGQKRF